MTFTFQAFLLAFGLFAGIAAGIELGRAFGRRFQPADAEKSRAGLGAVEASVFALLGLLIAFSFSGAASRFENRRALVAEESNAIGTAYLRLDFLPDPSRLRVQDLFREYVDSRIKLVATLDDQEAALEEYDRGLKLQQAIWSEAIAGCRQEKSPDDAKLLIPALNAMFDITETRLMAMRTHPPRIIFIMLFVVALVASLMAGFAMSAGRVRSHLHIFGFAAVLAVSIYVIYDIEYPRLGLIRVDDADETLIRLRATMDADEPGR